ncbi:MAG: hypothetical protein Q4G00_06140 [Clostridia bacterium]|nr:hypothetical protein [Clostridia bacterium]
MKKMLSFLLALLLLIPSAAFAADGTSNVYEGYTYDFYGNVKSTPSPFLLEKTITSENLKGISLDSVDDVCTSADGRIFLVDGKQSRVHVLDGDGKMLKTLKTIRDTDNKIVILEDGSQLMFNGCSGVFYHEKQNELYIADTAAQRVVVLDGENYTFKRLITKPANMTGVTEFKPAKVTVDNADRIYIVVQSSYEGIIELNEDGTFSRYFGVNEPQVNLVDFLWKSIATDAQKEKMGKTYAPAFNNVALDGEGFVMAVTSDLSANKPVFRLNFQGKNVIREMGSFMVKGDLHTVDGNASVFVDIAVKPYGTYAVLDKAYGRVFLYNFDGELLSVFGSKGNLNGEFKIPSAIAWLGDKLIIGDSALRCAYIMEPSQFGQALLDANEAYYYGRWDEATAHFEQVLRLCSNMETAYVGIGKNLLMQEQYKQAMDYFKLGNNREFFSKAYKGYRSEVLRDHFGVIAVIGVALIALVIGSEISYNRKQRRGSK